MNSLQRLFEDAEHFLVATKFIQSCFKYVSGGFRQHAQHYYASYSTFWRVC